MSRLAFLLVALMSVFAVCPQERKLEIFASGSDKPLCSWHVNPASVIKVDAATGVLVYDSANGATVQNPVVWLSEIDHMRFAYDPDAIPIMESGNSAGWHLSSPAGDYLYISPPEGTDLRKYTVPISIFDTDGRIVGGVDRWEGNPVRICRLPKGNYLIRIGSSVTLKFVKS